MTEYIQTCAKCGNAFRRRNFLSQQNKNSQKKTTLNKHIKSFSLQSQGNSLKKSHTSLCG